MTGTILYAFSLPAKADKVSRDWLREAKCDGNRLTFIRPLDRVRPISEGGGQVR